MVIACSNSSPSFSSDLCTGTFPLTVFEKSGAGLISDATAEEIILDEDSIQGIKLVKEGFKTQVTTHFAVKNLDPFFFEKGMGFEKTPKEWFQIIEITHEAGTAMITE